MKNTTAPVHNTRYRIQKTEIPPASRTRALTQLTRI